MSAGGRPERLSRSLTRMNMLVSGTALALACLAFAVYDILTFRALTVRQLSFQALVTATNAGAAIEFDDIESAGKTLAAFGASPEIRSAQLLTASGEVLASYQRSRGALPLAIPFPEDQLETHRYTRQTLLLARRVVVQGRQVGSVVIESTLEALYARVARYLVIVVGVLCTSLLAALLMSRLVQRSISQPLVELADVARQVSREQDYGLRASEGHGGSYEVQRVIRNFNSMLGQMQLRDRSLQAAHDELESRVRLRTEELDATNRELEAFTYSVSHDLRAPLRHVAGFAALLEQHAGDVLDGRSRGYLKTITDAASRMGRLIDDLLAFSRMGRASLSPETVDLARIVREARAEVGPETMGREIVWSIRPLPDVYADPALLRPVMVNLLSNAVKYSSTRAVAEIEIGADRMPSGVVVWVRDNGVGFDMQYAGKLFGVFQRLHRADEFSGTGIGLANVRRIISRHGGKTWAESELDRGATVFVSLPPAPHEKLAARRHE